MTDTEPGTDVPGQGTQPPARPPGPVPAGFLPREWVQAAPPPPSQPPSQPTPLPPPPPPDAWSKTPVPGTTPQYPGGYPAGGAWPQSPVAGSWPQTQATQVATAPARSPDVPFLDTPWVPPKTKHQGWIWLLYALIGFLVGQIGAFLFGEVAGVIAGKNATEMQAIANAAIPPEWYVVATLFGLWVGFIGAPWLASRTQGTRHFLRDLGVRFRLIDLVGIAIGIGGQICVAIMYAPFQHEIHDFNGPSQKLTGGSHGGGFVIIAIATVVLAPAMEELFFRGLLLKALVRILTPIGAGRGAGRVAGVVTAVILDGLLFGLAHGELVQLAGLAFFGMVLAAVSYRTGRLGMNMVAHATFNLVAIVAILGNGSGLVH
jgi:membrane protease YdiL (CAAX protease family)